MNDVDRIKLVISVEHFIIKVKNFFVLRDLLFEDLNFSTHLKNKIEEIQDDALQKRELIYCIAKRGPNAFRIFLKCLSETENSDLANFIEKLEGDINKVRMAVYRMDSDLTACYRMRSNPRGKALIVNIYHFDDRKKEPREGSDMDVHNLKGLLNGLGYEVATCSDLTGKELSDTVKRFSFDLGKTDIDSSVLVVMSHGISAKGREGVFFYGKDDALVYSDELVSLFSVEMCPAMTGKPKLFFFQACRGKMPPLEVKYTKDDLDRVKNLYSTSKSLNYDSPQKTEAGPSSNDSVNCSTNNRAAVNGCTNYDEITLPVENGLHGGIKGDPVALPLANDLQCNCRINGVENATTDSVVNPSPVGNGLYHVDEVLGDSDYRHGGLTDILVIYSSNPGYVALRDTKKGSWLMQEIVSVFSNEAYAKDIVTMLEMVQRNLSKREFTKLPLLQLMNYNSIAFKKKLYFNPGL